MEIVITNIEDYIIAVLVMVGMWLIYKLINRKQDENN